jgi:hypothetical protein
MQIDPADQYIIKNMHTENFVESHRFSEWAIVACESLNDHAVTRCKSFARYTVIDKSTCDAFYTSLNYRI